MPLVLLEDSEEYLKRFGQKVKQLRIANEKRPLRRGAKKGACLKKEVCSLQKYHRLEYLKAPFILW